MITVFATVFYSRSSVVTSLVNNYLTQHNSALTCIDFTLNRNFDLVITHLCIDSPYAEIELIDSLITWQFESNNIDVNKLSDVISAIKIATVNVRGKSDFQFPINTTPALSSGKSTLKLSELPTLIRKNLHDLALLVTPVDIDINTFSYQPFLAKYDKKNKEKKPYQGYFKANTKQLVFSLDNNLKENIFYLKLIKNVQSLRANVVADFAKLRSFSIQHEAALPVSLSTLLIDEGWSVTGKVNSQLNWHNQTLSMLNQLTDFSFSSSQYSSLLGTVQLDTALTWQTSLVGEVLNFDFTHRENQVQKQEKNQRSRSSNRSSNTIRLAFSSTKLTQSLTAKNIDPQVIKVIADNAINNLTVKPLGSLTIDLAKQKINSDGVNIISNNLNEPIELSLSDLAFSYRDEPAIIVNVKKAKFSLAGQVNINQLQPYTKHPVKLNIIGEVDQHSDIWQLTLNQGTSIELAQLSLPTVEPTGLASSQHRVEKEKNQPSVKSLLSYWQGNVSIPNNENSHQKSKSNSVVFDLDINNQIKQFNYPEVIQVNTTELNATLLGGVDDVIINTTLITDNVPIAIAKITGDLRHPSVAVSAKNLLLTDILALNIKLPVELKLIDGTLDYRLTGQLKNSEHLMANPMSLALSVQDLTGEVDGTWLQALNWQQHFSLEKGRVKSISNNINTPDNLTIAKIETVTPITNLVTRTVIDFSQDNITLWLHNTGGNLLGGRFDIEQAQWPFTKALPIDLKLTKIDLEKLLELDKKQGIVVTGNVSGNLPIFYDGEHLLIKEGRLQNVGDGLIQVYNNPAVEELKASGTQLKLAFDALENLHYHLLSSDVSMADDGYMLLATKIKGRNPDLDNDVNLNLNLSYDLIGLLESLNITERFENKVLKGLKH